MTTIAIDFFVFLFCNSAELNKKETFSILHEYIEQGEVNRGIVMTTCVASVNSYSQLQKIPLHQGCLFIRLLRIEATSCFNNFVIAARIEHHITQYFRVCRLITTAVYSLGRNGFMDC